MYIIKNWDWRYKIALDSKLKNDLLIFSEVLSPRERQIFQKTISHFSSFFSIGMMFDFFEENPLSIDSTISSLKLNDLLYAQKI